MIKDWEVYEGHCEACRHSGLIKVWTDDWGGTGVEFEGFWASETRIDRTGRETIAHAICPNCRFRGTVARGERLLCDLLPASTDEDRARARRITEIRAQLH